MRRRRQQRSELHEQRRASLTPKAFDKIERILCALFQSRLATPRELRRGGAEVGHGLAAGGTWRELLEQREVSRTRLLERCGHRRQHAHTRIRRVFHIRRRRRSLGVRRCCVCATGRIGALLKLLYPLPEPLPTDQLFISPLRRFLGGLPLLSGGLLLPLALCGDHSRTQKAVRRRVLGCGSRRRSPHCHRRLRPSLRGAHARHTHALAAPCGRRCSCARERATSESVRPARTVPATAALLHGDPIVAVLIPRRRCRA